MGAVVVVVAAAVAAEAAAVAVTVVLAITTALVAATKTTSTVVPGAADNCPGTLTGLDGAESQTLMHPVLLFKWSLWCPIKDLQLQGLGRSGDQEILRIFGTMATSVGEQETWPNTNQGIKVEENKEAPSTTCKTAFSHYLTLWLHLLVVVVLSTAVKLSGKKHVVKFAPDFEFVKRGIRQVRAGRCKMNTR